MNTLTFNKLYIFQHLKIKRSILNLLMEKTSLLQKMMLLEIRKVSLQFLKIYIILWEQTAILKISGMSKRRYPF